MIDIDSGENIEALYKMIQIVGGKRIEKFETTDINAAIKFHKWFVARYKTGLFMEILPKKKVYNPKYKKVNYEF